MPGIFGFKLKRGKSPDRAQELIHSMSEMLKHGDRYNVSVFSSDSVGLGVVDLVRAGPSHIHQDGRKGIVCCIYGSIFDFGSGGSNGSVSEGGTVEQRVVSAYLRHETGLAKTINGDFNATIHDPDSDRLILFNDRFGFRHTYIYEDDEILIFAPDLKAFLCYTEFSKTLDEQGLGDYFNYFYHLGDRTMFERVKLLPAACCVQVGRGGTKRTVYWEPRYTRELGIGDLDHAVETGYRLFQESMSRRVTSGGRYLVPLSGGLDSRLILAVAQESGCEVNTATFGSKHCHDYVVAKEVCSALGVTNHTRVGIKKDWVPRFGEELVRLGGGNYGTLASTRICGFARVMGNNYDGLLNGIFGGHLSFGSPYFRQCDLEDDALAKGDVGKIVRGFEGHRYEQCLSAAVSSSLNEIVRSNRKKSIEEEWRETASSSDNPAYRMDQFFLRNRIRRGMNYLDLNRYYYRSLLPFASYDLYRFYLSLGPDLLLGHRLYKEIFKRKFPHLARIPWSNTGVDLYSEPSAMRRKRKTWKRKFIWYSRKLARGRFEWTDQEQYMHYDRDFRSCALTRSWVEGILLSDRFLDRGYFRREGIRNLLKQEKWGNGLFYEIGKLVIFELWSRELLDGDGIGDEACLPERVSMWDRLTGCRQLRPHCMNAENPPPVKGAPLQSFN